MKNEISVVLNVLMVLVGLFIGLIFSNCISIPIQDISSISSVISAIATVTLAFLAYWGLNNWIPEENGKRKMGIRLELHKLIRNWEANFNRLRYAGLIRHCCNQENREATQRNYQPLCQILKEYQKDLDSTLDDINQLLDELEMLGSSSTKNMQNFTFLGKNVSQALSMAVYSLRVEYELQAADSLLSEDFKTRFTPIFKEISTVASENDSYQQTIDAAVTFLETNQTLD